MRGHRPGRGRGRAAVDRKGGGPAMVMQTSDSEDAAGAQVREGLVKWFDAARGFGFIVDDGGGPDILLHANVLRDFGQGAVADGTRMRVTVTPTRRGMQAAQVLAITPPPCEAGSLIPELAGLGTDSIAALPLQPARVKWFDRQKGFGFANLFGQPGDVFLHAEVLRHSGFADLGPGEAVALRVVAGRRGLMAAEVVVWDRACQPDAGSDG